MVSAGVQYCRTGKGEAASPSGNARHQAGVRRYPNKCTGSERSYPAPVAPEIGLRSDYRTSRQGTKKLPSAHLLQSAYRDARCLGD